MRLLIGFLIWLLLFVCSPVIAVLALVAFPVVWLISIPVRLVAMIVSSLLSLIKAILMLPSRLVSVRPVA